MMELDFWGKTSESDDGGESTREPRHRRVRLTPAAAIPIRAVRWLWADRIALGTLCLLAGREGIGKSTVAYQLAADLTRGLLPGKSYGEPRAVIVAASEDSWSHTIVPRLMAAGADLDLVYRIDVETYTGFATEIVLPNDLVELKDLIVDVQAAMVLLDPLMSRLDASLDSHKDSEVRRALEPLVRVADQTGASMLGIIHLNKSTTSDPLTMVMGSRAFAAVARSVLFCMVDPDNEGALVIGQPKNNLGRTDLPTLGFTIVQAYVGTDDDGDPIYTGQVHWSGESARSLTDMIESAADGSEVRTAVQEAADWLTDWLTHHGGTDHSTPVKKAAAKSGHSLSSLHKARKRVGVIIASTPGVFPRETFWTLPGTAVVPSPEAAVVPSPGESTYNRNNNNNRVTVVPAVPVVSVVQDPPRGETTASPDGCTTDPTCRGCGALATDKTGLGAGGYCWPCEVTQ